MAGSERQLLVKILGDATGVKKAMQETGEGAGRLSGHMGALAGAVGGALALGAVVDFGAKSVEKFDEIASATKRLQRLTGDTAESMSAMRFAAEETGVGTDTLEVAIKKLSKATIGADAADGKRYDTLVVQNAKAQEQLDLLNKVAKPTEAQAQRVWDLTQKMADNNDEMSNLGTGVGKLGFSMMDANGTMKDTHHLLMDISDKFKGMPDGIEKNALAMKLFGKSGTDMIPFLNKGSEGIADLEKEASKFGLVIGQDSVDAMTKNKLAHRQMHAAWEGMQVMIGEKLMPIVSKFTSWMAENLPSALAWVRDALNKLQPVFDFIKDTMGRFFEVMSTWLKWLENHKGIFIAVGAAIGVLLIALNPIPAVIAALVLLIGNFDAIKAAVERFINRLPELAGKLWSWIKDAVPRLLEELGKMLLALGTWIITTALPAIVEKLLEWGAAFLEWIVPAVAKLPGQLLILSAKLFFWMLDTAASLGLKAVEFGVKILSFIPGLIVKLPGALLGVAESIWTWIAGVVTAIPTKFVGVVEAIGSGIMSALKGVWNVVAKWWNEHIGGKGFTVPSWIPLIGGDEVRVPNLPTFAGGGIVPGSYGNISGAVHGNEMVLNPTQQSSLWNLVTGNRASTGVGGTPIVINVAGSVVTSGQLIDEVYNGLLRKQQRFGSLGFR